MHLIHKAAIAAALAVLITHPTSAAEPEDFYKGKTLSLVIGYSVGGGYDAYGRLAARHLGKHIPGNPSVVAQNMTGAGSLKAANYLYSVAAKDGSVIGTFSRSQGIAPLLGKAEFDSTRFTWLGSVTDEVSLCVTRHDSPVKTWSDVLARETTFGGERGSDPNIFALLYRNVFGAKLKIVTGYPSTNGSARDRARQSRWSLRIVLEHAEGPLSIGSTGQEGQHSGAGRDQSRRSPVCRRRRSSKTPEQMQTLKLVLIGQAMARPFAAPPIPAERKAA